MNALTGNEYKDFARTSPVRAYLSIEKMNDTTTNPYRGFILIP
jgi:hypothetical protein